MCPIIVTDWTGEMAFWMRKSKMGRVWWLVGWVWGREMGGYCWFYCLYQFCWLVEFMSFVVYSTLHHSPYSLTNITLVSITPPQALKVLKNPHPYTPAEH